MPAQETVKSLGIDGSMACIGICGLSETKKILIKGFVKSKSGLNGVDRMRDIFMKFVAQIEEVMTEADWESLEVVSVESPVVGRENIQTALKLGQMTGILLGYFISKKPSLIIYNPCFAEIKDFYGFKCRTNRLVGKRDVGYYISMFFGLNLVWDEKQEGYTSPDDPDFNADVVDATAHALFAMLQLEGVKRVGLKDLPHD